jgi:hypothetical protein
MPAVLYVSTVKDTGNGFSLALTARHTVQVGQDTSRTLKARGRMPNINVVHRGDIIFSLSGVANGRKVPATVMAHATPSKHLLAFLKQVSHI